MISNIVLNELDHELERRGHRYCRWADDFLVFLKSERAAKRVMAAIISYLEEDLGLPVNKEKSKVAPVIDLEFLGFQIYKGKIGISDGARTKFKQRIKELTRRNNPLSMYEVIQELNEYLLGWISYYRVQEFRTRLKELDGWIRSRLRSMQLKKWKNPRKFQRILISSGYSVGKARKTWIRMKSWQSTMRVEVRFVLSLQWFRKQKVIFLMDYISDNLEFQFNR